MVQLTVDFPDGLYSNLGDLVDESRFKSKNEAVRYYVRAGLQRETIDDIVSEKIKMELQRLGDKE